MKDLLFKTNENLASSIPRIALGIVILIHGSTKQGSGFAEFEGFITGYMQLSAIVAYATVFIETAGALMLILGAATRLNAIAMFGLFCIIIITVHSAIGFQMNWNGQYDAGMEGYEYHLLVLTICAGLIVLSGGRFSIDHVTQSKNSSKTIKANN
ncbi:DoxX family protein [Aquimarina sp. U1-2]|uniref:DoxX family protein n=1 Tax=Aquimarina sp. U1-2 TaxID=2823141 RepID=UPI001AECBFE3|nr:DoxX family protein [Aquimarina sp. U1-2]MBP2831095.1 DoxX family protein [Aquimarina sp. U1-2]